MSETESLLTCAVVAPRARADDTVEALATVGIPATLQPPGHRYNKLPPDSWEILVPASQAARARAILDRDRS